MKYVIWALDVFRIMWFIALVCLGGYTLPTYFILIMIIRSLLLPKNGEKK